MTDNLEKSSDIVAYLASDSDKSLPWIQVLTDSGKMRGGSLSEVNGNDFLRLRCAFGVSAFINTKALLAVQPPLRDSGGSTIILVGFHRLEVEEKQSSVFSKLAFEMA